MKLNRRQRRAQAAIERAPTKSDSVMLRAHYTMSAKQERKQFRHSHKRKDTK